MVRVTTQPRDKGQDGDDGAYDPEDGQVDTNPLGSVQLTVPPTVHPVVIAFVEDVECGEHHHVDEAGVEEPDQVADEARENPLVADECDHPECHGEEGQGDVGAGEVDVEKLTGRD